MKTLIRMSFFLSFLLLMESKAYSGITLAADTYNNAPSQLATGQNFDYTINFSWSNASYGSHVLYISLNFPSSLDFVGASRAITGPTNGVITCQLPMIIVPSGSFNNAPLGSGSGTLILTVHFRNNTPGGTQACLTGTISEYNVSSASTISKYSNSAHCAVLPTAASCQCSGVLSYSNLAGGTAKTNVVYDIGNMTPVPCGDINFCQSIVSARISQLTAANPQIFADNACISNAPNGSQIRAFAMLGTQSYFLVKPVGTLTIKPAVSTTTCNCPPDWTSNTSNVAGGVTTDGKCKKLVAKMNISPVPPNTTIGTWGFTDGLGIYVWGSSANGGVPVCTTTVTTPAVCKIQ